MSSLCKICLLLISWLVHGYEIQNVTYTTVGGTPLMMNIYILENATDKNPCLIYIHGGGWSSGSRHGVPQDIWQAGIDNDMILASIDYRLTSQTGQYGNKNVTFPAQIDDVRSAVKFLKDPQNAVKYQIDVNRMGCWGTSAGAHLCGLAGSHFSDSPQNLTFAVLYYAPTDIQDMETDCRNDVGTNYDCSIQHDMPPSPESMLIFCDPSIPNCYNPGIGELRSHQNDQSGSWPYYEKLVNDANPITFVTKDNLDKLPYFWISAGYNDTLVPYLQSVRMNDALKAIGQNEEKYTMELCSCLNTTQYPKGCGHGTSPEDCWDPIDKAVDQWLGQWKN